MSKFDFFWKTINLCDRSTKGDGDDQKILKPIVDYLAKCDNEKIFEFDDLMNELLYDLDTQKLFCEWRTSETGYDKEIIEVLVESMVKGDRKKTFDFNDLMNELLHDPDTQKLFDECVKNDDYVSEDSFLYSRCVALINGEEYYEKVKAGEISDLWSLEFEAILYVPSEAWAIKNNSEPDQYPHISKYSYV